MGSVKVTVYGRVKPRVKNSLNQEYYLKNGDHEDQITFVTNKISSGKKTYRFKKIFPEDASQEEVFETVAKPIIKSVLTGYNGTIFTYGQTGSGKTYTMTGDLEGWLNPGLIPRTVQEIFKQKDRGTNITITYCEIYNEHVYDLIRVDPMNPDLPQVSLMEDSSGITHFRNLSVHLVESAFEALQLLVRGDANKMVAETNSNARSSRSHVIFSIGLKFPHPTEAKLCLKPVLYLVDLAGSEKLSKCKTPMNNPMETRYINLSLHYLEQVLIALRQPGRNHIPYRNSLMTALLRNSLGGNCITAMIATFSLTVDDLDETLQTCRFAERIALIKNEVKLNELVDPAKEIQLLKKENDKLKAQLKIIGFSQAGEDLTEKDRGRCAEMVKNFIKDNDLFNLPLTDIKRLECCFHLMREEILKKQAKETESRKIDKPDSVLALAKRQNDCGSAKIGQKQGNSMTVDRSRGSENSNVVGNAESEANSSSDEEDKQSEGLEKKLLKSKASKAMLNYPLEEKMTQESLVTVKFNEFKGGRKRTPMDLPKINVTYKKCKSTEAISVSGCDSAVMTAVRSGELKAVQANVSDFSLTIRERNSESSLEKEMGEGQRNKEQQGERTYEPNILSVRESGIFTRQNGSSETLTKQNGSSETLTKRIGSNATFKLQNCEISNELKGMEEANINVMPVGSNFCMKRKFSSHVYTVTTQSPLSSDEKLMYGEVKKLISVGIQVENNDSSEFSTDEVSLNSNVESNSTNSLDATANFGKSLPLTGDKDVDEEIVKFYKARYETLNKK